jgi:hypothetical protein
MVEVVEEEEEVVVVVVALGELLEVTVVADL